jgi:Coenzyme PQQ synthesis protein D (PqqD)
LPSRSRHRRQPRNLVLRLRWLFRCRPVANNRIGAVESDRGKSGFPRAVESGRLSVTNDSVVVRDNQLAAADVDGRAVVLSIGAGSYFDFNQVGTEIWNMLAEPCRVDEIFHRLSQQHDVDAETLSRDVIPFLRTLVDERLIRMVTPEERR